MIVSDKRPSVGILLPSIGNLIFVILFFTLVFNLRNGLLGDGDTGYHIRTGEFILDHWTVPTRDIFSFLTPPLPWTAHEWLSEVIMAVIYRAFGLTGIVLFFAFVLALTHWFLYKILRDQSHDIILTTLITLLATATSSTHWLARPHIFTLALTLICYRLLDAFQYKGGKTLLYLPLLMLFWVNLHAGYIVGLILLAIFLGGNLVVWATGSPTLSTHSTQKAKKLLLIGLASLAVCMINPYGYNILLFPFRITSDLFLMDRVTEFLSPNFHHALPFKYMMLLTIATLALSRTAVDSIELGLVLLLSYMALYSARHVSLFAIIVSPIVLRLAESIVRGMPTRCWRFYQKRIQNLESIEARTNGYLWPSLTVFVVLLLSAAGVLRFNFDDKVFPVAAVEFLKRETIRGNMFNNDEFGDYLIFAAWPQYKVFTDGRSDMYGATRGNEYLRVANVQPRWKDVLTKYDITWIIFDTDSALTTALRDQNEWHPIYSDKVATIFVKNDTEHGALVAKYPAVRIRGDESGSYQKK